MTPCSATSLGRTLGNATSFRRKRHSPSRIEHPTAGNLANHRTTRQSWPSWVCEHASWRPCGPTRRATEVTAPQPNGLVEGFSRLRSHTLVEEYRTGLRRTDTGELIAARGSTFRNGNVTLFRDRRSPDEITTIVSQLFLDELVLRIAA